MYPAVRPQAKTAAFASNEHRPSHLPLYDRALRDRNHVLLSLSHPSSADELEANDYLGAAFSAEHALSTRSTMKDL
jgi:hypothetical protein